MTRRLLGLAVAAALWFGATSEARAQFSLTIGSPYYGYGYGYPYGAGYGYGYPYGGFGPGLRGPMTSYYSSGYYGLGAPGLGVSAFRYPGYGSGLGYGYPGYGSGLGYGYPGYGSGLGYGYPGYGSGYYGYRAPGLGIANRILGSIFGGRGYGYYGW